jgi:hypothetical protein
VLTCAIAYSTWVLLVTTVLSAAGPLGPYVGATKACFNQAIYGGSPPDHITELVVVVDSICTWWVVAISTLLNQLASSIASDIVDPWCTNELNDDKIKRIRFGYWRTLVFVTFYRVAAWLDYIMFLFISLQRPDFMIIGLLADIGCRAWTTRVHLNHKKSLQFQSTEVYGYGSSNIF